jgi:hypothetical protein
MLFKSLVSKLKIASATVLGGIKVGDNLTIEPDGKLNAVSTDISVKADKVAISPSPAGYVATFDSTGNLAVSDRQVSTDIPPDPTAANDFIVATGSPAVWNKKTLEETKTILGVGSAIHNNLEGLDGGSASPEEYYHLDSADYNALTDANAQLEQLQTDGSPTFEFVKSKIKEIYKTQSSESPLTVAQCKRTIVSNYGMTDADCAITLPAAAEGLAFMCILPAVRERYFRLTAGAGDKIYLSGTAGNDAGYVGVASGYATGTACQMFTFKASDGGFDWFCLPIFGTWIAG